MREVIWSAGPSRHDCVRYDSVNHLFPGKKFSDYRKIYCDVTYNHLDLISDDDQCSMVVNDYPVEKWIELSQDKYYQAIHEIVYLSDSTWKKNNPKTCVHSIVGVRSDN